MINPYSLRNMRAKVPDLASLYSNTPMSMDPSSAFSSSMVTGAPVASTGGVAESPWSPRWIDMPWSIQGNSGNTQLPTINASDILFRPEETRWVNPDTESGGWQETLPNRWEWASPDVRSRYSWFGTPRTDSVTFLPGDDPNSFYAQIKSADKQGTRVRYVKQGNEYVPLPETSGNVGWDTNSGFSDILPALAVMAPAIAGIIAPGLFGGAAGAAGAEAAASGLPASLGGIEGVIGGATAAPNLMTGLGTGFAGTSAMTGTLPSILPGLAAGGAAAGVAGSIGIGDILRGINTVGDAVGGIGDLVNPGGDNVGRRASGLPGLLSALYGNYANRMYAGDLRSIAGTMQQLADPYLQKLRESYENPEAYLNSPEMKAVLGLEANKLAGIDASQGRLSNDINRTALLQKLAQSRLGDYRSGLQQTVRSIYKPEAFVPLLQKAAEEDATRYSDLIGWAGAGGSAGDVWNDIKDVIDAGSDIWDVISGWWD